MKKIGIILAIIALSFSIAACGLSEKSDLKKITDGKSFTEWEMDMVEQLQAYDLNEDERKILEKIDEDSEDVKDNDYKHQLYLAKKLIKLSEDIDSRFEESANELLEELSDVSVPYASEEDKNQLLEYSKEVKEMISDHDFSNLKEVSESWYELVKNTSSQLTGLNVNIVQFDYTNYPTVRMYVDVKDNSGNVVTNLSPNMFFVSEKKVSSGDFQSVTIKNISMLDE